MEYFLNFYTNTVDPTQFKGSLMLIGPLELTFKPIFIKLNIQVIF